MKSMPKNRSSSYRQARRIDYADKRFSRLKSAAVTRATRQIAAICGKACKAGLMDGLSGNASQRITEDTFLITSSGISKGALISSDFALLEIKGKQLLGRKKPSSEWRLHAALYGKFSNCKAILHTHPKNLQALAWRLAEGGQTLDRMFSAPLDEGAMWANRFAIAKDAPLGSPELGQNAAAAFFSGQANTPLAIWLPRHGLCAFGDALKEVLNITSELEHIACVMLKYLASGGQLN